MDRPAAPAEVCPLCGGALTCRQCKQLCRSCGALVSNCNGD